MQKSCNLPRASFGLLIALLLPLPSLLTTTTPVARSNFSNREETPSWKENARSGAVQGEKAIAQLKKEGAYESLTEALAAASYAIEAVPNPQPESGTGIFEAVNPAQSIRVRFAGREVRVHSNTDRPWELNFRLLGYGYGREVVALDSGETRAKGRRVEFDKQAAASGSAVALTEWYENKPAGLEQGFTIFVPPAATSNLNGRGKECLRIVLSLTGNVEARAREDGQALQLKNDDGRDVATYNHLKAWDAKGRELPARMRVSGRELSLEVDDAGAEYPITIDPTLAGEIPLVAQDGAAKDLFGWAVAISGNTAIVGAQKPSSPGGAYIFVRNGTTWTQQAKLGDDRTSYKFGGAVAISGDTVVVGDTSALTDTGTAFGRYGAVFVSNRTGNTWSPLTKILANEYTPIRTDDFGWSVAISNNTIVVGAPTNDDSTAFGSGSRGVVYVFVRAGADWVEQARVLASDGVANDQFGFAVALSGDTAIIGAPNHGGHGSAYILVRSVTSWAEQAQIAGDGSSGERFGYSVALSGDTAIAGTARDSSRGAAYVYVRNGVSWSLQQQLSGDSAADRYFGFSVAISKDQVAVGDPTNDFAANTVPGAACLYARANGKWALQRRITSSDGVPGDGFGNSVGINVNGIALIGAPGHDLGAKTNQGQAYIFGLPDADGDGLPDDWEINGVTIDGVFIDLPHMGAKPMHKDLFVHADWLHAAGAAPNPGFKPNSRTMKAVVQAFARAPVENPDLKPGINLHVDLGPETLMNPGQTWGGFSKAGEQPYAGSIGLYSANPNPPPAQVYDWSAVDALKDKYFNPAKRKAVFHYMIFCNTYAGSNSSGLTRGISGADFIVALGDAGNTRTLPQISGTFMHELGHNLGLLHGGDEDVNHKPNYLSIMNYSFQKTGLLQKNGRQATLDYSHSTLDPLVETRLDENIGINDPEQHVTFWRFPAPNELYYQLFYPTGALDWNFDEVKNSDFVEANINGVDADGNSALTTLTGFNDWPALLFDGGGRIGNAAGIGDIDPMATPDNETPSAEVLSGVPQQLVNQIAAAPVDDVSYSPMSGGSPLTVDFDGSASSTAGGTVVAWNWDFGDGSTGSGPVVSHTYTTTGDYYAVLTVTTSSGAVNYMPLYSHVEVTNAPPTPTPTPTATPAPTATPTPSPTATPTPSKANLTPYKPSGWADKVVISKVKATHTDDTGLLATDSLFVDFAVINNGGSGISNPFKTRLLIDDVVAGTFVTNPPLNSGGFYYVEDFPVGPLSAGVHAIKIVTDADGQIAEGNETDNEYLRAISVAAPPIPISQTFTVKNTNDSGADSLRQALLDANTHPNSTGSIDRIVFSIPGAGVKTITPLSLLPAITDRVLIDGYTQPGTSVNTLSVGDNAVLLIEVEGSKSRGPFGTVGFSFQTGASGSTIRGLIINRFTSGSLNFAQSVLIYANDVSVLGNFIGTDSTGTTALGNDVAVATSPGFGNLGGGNQIGTSAPADRNIISGNASGILLESSSTRTNTVQNNYIGVDAGGNTILRNSNAGIIIEENPSSKIQGATLIGGIVPGAGNVISGNERGILIGVDQDSGALGAVNIQGNIIGLGADGTTLVGNFYGIEYTTRSLGATLAPMLIGGTFPAARNIISGNAEGMVYASKNTTVQGNFIGTDVTGTLERGNADAGILVIGDHRDPSNPSATTITIGGTAPGAGNVISGNHGNGINTRFANAIIQGNYIGTQSDGFSPLGNLVGIEVLNFAAPVHIMVGGTAAGAGNVIAHNITRGVSVGIATVTISGNSIFGNGGAEPRYLGIDLGGDGVNPNDPGDSDSGPNNLQNYPLLTSSVSTGGTTSVRGTLNSVANTIYHIEFFGNDAPDPSGFGEGKTFAGAADVATDANGNASFDISVPHVAGLGLVTCTATDPNGNTSEFSPSIGHLANISTRLRVQSGDDVLIGGFIVTGTDPKRVMVRGIGPSLPVEDKLADPTLELFDSSGKSIGSNDNWRDALNRSEIVDSKIPPTDELEAVILKSVAPGAYTAVLRGANSTTGIGLVEVYDLDLTVDSKLANISSRGLVQTADNVMIGGFIITGSGPQKVIVRAIGPTLPVDGRLADPTLELHNGNGAIIEANDNWVDSPNKQAIIDSTIPPTNTLESAIVQTLTPGNYTAIVRGVNNSTGVAVVEVYALN